MSGVPLYSYYGEPANRSSRPAWGGPNATMAPPSGPYLGSGNKCAANDDTCEGRKAKGTDYCYGHARSLGVIQVKEVSDGNGSSNTK